MRTTLCWSWPHRYFDLKTWSILTLTCTSWNGPKSHPRIVCFLLGSLGIKDNLWYSSKKSHRQESKVRSSRKCRLGLAMHHNFQRVSSWAEIVLKAEDFKAWTTQAWSHFCQVRRADHSWEKTFSFSTTKLLFIPAKQWGKWNWKQARHFADFPLGVNLFT